MEESEALGSKEKKYVLYSVVGDSGGKTPAGVWAVRIILGLLLAVALAVVPYVSLRMAQINDRTLVVFQPVLVRNQSKVTHTTTRDSLLTLKSVHNSNILQSASLKRESTSATQAPDGINSKNYSNGTILTLRETTVTFSLLDDSSNATKEVYNSTIESKENEEPKDDLGNSTARYTPAMKITKEVLESSSTNYVDEKTSPHILASTTKVTKYMQPKTTSSGSPLLVTLSTNKMAKNSIDNFSTEGTPLFEESTDSKPETTKYLTGQKPPHPTMHSLMTHKLAYVAAAASGNHLGGVCIWKINNNITQWSYFFDNIPMEYQSRMDDTDRQLRGLLVAVRLWASKWDDYHVVLKSQSQSIKKSKHNTRAILSSELDANAENHFTYDLEWRLRKDDNLVAIAYSLARIYRDYNFWSNKFEQKLETVIGKQKGSLSKMRIPVPQEVFAIDQVEKQLQTGGLDALDFSRN